jgi:hypothetical protein
LQIWRAFKLAQTVRYTELAMDRKGTGLAVPKTLREETASAAEVRSFCDRSTAPQGKT